MSTQHILDAIDGALEWDSREDAMRWTPPEAEPPEPAVRVPPARPTVRRVTIVVETDNDMECVEIPEPLTAEFNFELREEEDPYRWYRVSSLPAARDIRIGLDLKLGDAGYTVTAGRQHARDVLRRIIDAS